MRTLRAVCIAMIVALGPAAAVIADSTSDRDERVSVALARSALPDEWRLRLIPIAQVLDESSLAATRGDLLALRSAGATLEQLVVQLLEWSSNQAVQRVRVEVPGVLIVDLSDGNITYTEDARLIVDLAGDDIYLNNAGGSNTARGRCDPIDARGVALLIDIRGDDAYGNVTRSVDQRRGCGANGGGYFGLGGLFDGAGHDTYASGHAGANGGGWSGVGILRDYGGDDYYTAGDGGVNGGGAAFGSGSVEDLEGNDTYSSKIREGPGPVFIDGGTNGGANLGQGCLIDFHGNDSYIASTFGVNGGVQDAGLGLLLDLAGSDIYVEDGRGTRTDETVAPKGTLGAQIDVTLATAFPSPAVARCS